MATAARSAPAGGVSLRWPAEWERHAATWLAWPHNPETWPECLAAAQQEMAGIVRALHGREPLVLLVPDARAEDAARARLSAAGVDPDRGVTWLPLPTNDAWLRDSGPVFVWAEGPGGRREKLALDFGFDAWGGKYPPWDLDDAVPRRIAEWRGVERRSPGFVLEGGSVDGNGRGTVLTTESCLLDAKREPGRTREQMEQRLATWLGARHVIWLGEGIAGDDTDGHVDDLARFADPSTIVACREDDPADPNHATLAENWRRLRDARDQDGKPLSVVMLPMPPARRAGGARLPASYANFYLANGVALVPSFGLSADADALARLRELWPDREVIGVGCGTLVRGLGAVHCLTQSEPG